MPNPIPLFINAAKAGLGAVQRFNESLGGATHGPTYQNGTFDPGYLAGLSGEASIGSKVAKPALSILEKLRAPGLLHVLTPQGHTVQAIHPKDFEAMKNIVDTGSSNIAQQLQNKTGASFHISPTSKAQSIIGQGALPIPGYAQPAAITRLAGVTPVAAHTRAGAPVVQHFRGLSN